MIQATILLLILLQNFMVENTGETNFNECGQLYLTQSPNKKQNLQINWKFTCADPPDTILLTLGDIKTDPSSQILHQINPGSVLKGFHLTNIYLKDVKLPGNWTENGDNPNLDAQCFVYYIASVRKEKVVYSQCLSIQPTWMSKFGDLRIGDLMIPGTHNSGAWRGAPLLIQNYVLNQDKNFWQQLVYGIRYFDIRVGRYGSPPKGLYINHAFIKCTDLVPELESVANFLKKSPKEVVVLNFHRFPHPKNFAKEYHYEILNLLKDIFGDMIYPFNKVRNRRGPKMKEFWEDKQRIIVSYRDNIIVNELNWLWPSVNRDWGNVQKVEDLQEYIISTARIPLRGNPMRVVMAELTPSYASVLKHVTRDLKDLSVMVNRELSDWLRENNRSNNLNIVATDFFTGNDVVNVAIETNFRKLNNYLFN